LVGTGLGHVGDTHQVGWGHGDDTEGIWDREGTTDMEGTGDMEETMATKRVGDTEMTRRGSGTGTQRASGRRRGPWPPSGLGTWRRLVAQGDWGHGGDRGHQVGWGHGGDQGQGGDQGRGGDCGHQVGWGQGDDTEGIGDREGTMDTEGIRDMELAMATKWVGDREGIRDR